VVKVPPHTLLGAVLATVSPVGRVSLKATPASGCVLADGLVSVNCNEVVPFRGIALGLKTLAIAGGATMASCAVLLVAPVPPPVEVIALVVLFLVPVLVPVTLTEKVQEEPAAGDAVNVPPDRVMALLAAVAVIVPLPQEPVMLGVVATTTPAGKLSMKATPLNALAVFGLVIVKLKVLLPFNATLVGVKPLLIVGGDTTVMLALETPLMPPSVEVTATLLVAGPGVVPVTLTENVHEDPAAGDAVSVPPDKLMEPLPPVAVIAPLPQLPVKLGVAATIKPLGSVSVNATPLNATLVFGFWIVKLKVLLPVTGMLAGLNDLVMFG